MKGVACGRGGCAAGLPAGVLGLQDIQQQLLDVAWRQLVDVLGGHVPSPNLQLVLHGLDDPPASAGGDAFSIYSGGWQTEARGPRVARRAMESGPQSLGDSLPLERHCSPDSDLEHAAEQLRVVGDDPADVDDQLLLQNRFPLGSARRALAVDDALDHPRRQRVGDHLLLLPKQAQSHLAKTGGSGECCSLSWSQRARVWARWSGSVCVCVCVRNS